MELFKIEKSIENFDIFNPLLKFSIPIEFFNPGCLGFWIPGTPFSSKRRICRAWKSSNVDIAGLASPERPIEEISFQFALFGVEAQCSVHALEQASFHGSFSQPPTNSTLLLGHPKRKSAIISEEMPAQSEKTFSFSHRCWSAWEKFQTYIFGTQSFNSWIAVWITSSFSSFCRSCRFWLCLSANMASAVEDRGNHLII